MKVPLVLFMTGCALLSSVAHADKLTMLIGSYHIDRQAENNEVNPGLFYNHYFKEDNFLYLGAYKNSQSRTSVAAGIGKQVQLSQYMAVYGSIGIVSGYKNQWHYPALPQATIGLTIANRVDIMFVPGGKDSVFGLGLTLGEW